MLRSPMARHANLFFNRFICRIKYTQEDCTYESVHASLLVPHLCPDTCEESSVMRWIRFHPVKPGRALGALLLCFYYLRQLKKSGRISLTIFIQLRTAGKALVARIDTPPQLSKRQKRRKEVETQKIYILIIREGWRKNREKKRETIL